MNRTIIKLFLCLCIVTALPSYAYNTVHYYFRTVDIRNGLSQNSVNCIFQDKKGFMWFGTKDGLSRYDGLSFRIYNNENSNLGRNFITVLYEDSKGNIWVGTDGGLYIYNPILDSFTEFNLVSDKGTIIRDFVTMISAMNIQIFGYRLRIRGCFTIIVAKTNCRITFMMQDWPTFIVSG